MGKKEKFIYNAHTLSYEKLQVSLKSKFFKALMFLSGVVVAGFLFTMLVWKLFPSPSEQALLREIDQLKGQITLVEHQFNDMSMVLNNIQDRDANVHRMLFGMDPIDKAVWQAGVGGSNRYEDVVKYKNSSEVILNIRNKADQIRRQLAIQSRSLDTLQKMSDNREAFLASIPQIKPVREDKLNRSVKLLSGFGYRVHPIFKVPKMHTGIDFSAPMGTPIQSTGAGKVVGVERKSSGYGLHVIIDHGYGYETLYGHMSRVDVKIGQKVVRGQQIGLIGNSGTSTAPHCHYEIKFKGEKINPINYVMDGLTPEEYEDLKHMANSANQSFD